MTQITARITMRKDTAANWTAANPILSDAEFAKETDTGKIKIGNGVTAWNSLPYFTSGAGSVDSVNGQTGTVVLDFTDVGADEAGSAAAALASANSYTDTGLAGKQNSLGYTAENQANKDTDGTLAANSDTKYPSQKAAKTYIDTGLSGKQNTLGFTPENVSNKDIDGTLAANSDTKYSSQKAVKTYVDTGLSAKQNSLGFTPENVANKDTDDTFGANSDTLYPSQKAVKSYVDSGLSGKQNSLGFTPENVSNKKGTLNNSSTEYPTSAAVLTGLADNKKARVSTITTTTALTPDLDSYDQYIITTLASNIIINASTGGVNGSSCLIWIKDNGTSRTITLNANYVDLFGQVPTATTIGKWTVIGFVRRNEDSNKDHVIAGNTQG